MVSKTRQNVRVNAQKRELLKDSFNVFQKNSLATEEEALARLSVRDIGRCYRFGEGKRSDSLTFSARDDGLFLLGQRRREVNVSIRPAAAGAVAA